MIIWFAQEPVFPVVVCRCLVTTGRSYAIESCRGRKNGQFTENAGATGSNGPRQSCRGRDSAGYFVSLGPPHSNMPQRHPTNIPVINVLHISFCPRRNRKKDGQKDGTRRVYMPCNPFRQIGARRHAFCVYMRKVYVRQTPKSAYGAQLHEIYR